MEFNNNKPLIFVVIFFVLCFTLIGGVWYSLYSLSTYREEYDLLASERDSFSSNMDRLKAKRAALEQINKINFTHSEKASDLLEFYSNVRNAVDKNGIEIFINEQSASASYPFFISSNKAPETSENPDPALFAEENSYSKAMAIAEKLKCAEEEEYVVLKYDALWTILKAKIGEREDVREFIYLTTKRNGLENVQIFPGNDCQQPY